MKDRIKKMYETNKDTVVTAASVAVVVAGGIALTLKEKRRHNRAVETGRSSMISDVTNFLNNNQK